MEGGDYCLNLQLSPQPGIFLPHAGSINFFKLIFQLSLYLLKQHGKILTFCFYSTYLKHTTRYFPPHSLTSSSDRFPFLNEVCFSSTAPPIFSSLNPLYTNHHILNCRDGEEGTEQGRDVEPCYVMHANLIMCHHQNGLAASAHQESLKFHRFN